MIAAASEAAVLAHRTLGLRDLSRVDFIVDGEGTPWFLEANVLPGLTETSLVPLAIEASGSTRRCSTASSCGVLTRGGVAGRAETAMRDDR